MDSDETLYARLVGGDLTAFDRLYERYERPLHGFLCAQLGDRQEAEDVFHEAFMAVLRARDQRAKVRSFRAWLFQVARNLCLNRVRSRKRADRALHGLAHEPAAPALDEAAAGQGAAALQAAVQRLPSPLGEVYQLRAGGLSYEECASVLDVPIGTVKSRIHEMVRRLREEMQ
jgi:RNA polymerase sigma-70 factor, ECF subfamily